MDPILNAGLSRGITLLMVPAVSDTAEWARDASVATQRRARGGARFVSRLRLEAGGALVATGAGIAAAGRRLAGAAAPGPAVLPRGCG